ncbi:hypothetical protein C7212DRAFT_365481 [Tuber magnatum]|uniref:L-tryptophan decarboxylase PsiD-like domain-containing protein n=1 Tax=Tuber magnatum TaxID=42249 RepID=A0A317SHP3_9PEZI|nr:hypothetical protein C7212DRAFT_365481 [Tuber magnatum]
MSTGATNRVPRLQRLLDQVDRKRGLYDSNEPFVGVIQEFKELIETDPAIYMLFHQMFHQVPLKPPYDNDPTGKPQVRNYIRMLECFNEIMTTAPAYQKDTGLVGFPLNAIIDWPMGTTSGFAAFLNEKVNAQFTKVLNYWGNFLKSPESAYVLNDDPESGWFGEAAMSEELMQNFSTTYICDPAAQHYGFTSWDDFFVREFRPDARLIELPDDDRFIINACESGPYSLQTDVKAMDRFWIKGQPYSVSHMLAQDPLADQFVGGTHSPVNGTIVKKVQIPGTYYSEARVAGFDEAAPNESQGYITEVATRALVFIQADNPNIGLMCFMAVGMAEVSTCEVTVDEGDQVKKGDQLGMFHFGGSTHCLMFRKGVKVIFELPEEPGLDANIIQIHKVIAFVPDEGDGQ